MVVESGGETAPLALPVAYRDDDLTVYRVGGDYPAASHRPVMIAAHLVWLALLAIGAAGMALSTARRFRVRRSNSGPAPSTTR